MALRGRVVLDLMELDAGRLIGRALAADVPGRIVRRMLCCKLTLTLLL